MLDDVKKGLDTASSLLGGPGGDNAGAADPGTPTFFNADDLSASDAKDGGSFAPHDEGKWDNGAIIEFIHFGGVHPDNSKHFHHDKLQDDKKIDDFGDQPRSRAIMFRAALERETLLLSQFMFACQSVLKEKEDSKGGAGELMDMASDYLGGGGGSKAPQASDVNAFIDKVAEVGKKINVANAEYKVLHQAGIDLHQARTDYRAFLQSVINAPAGQDSGGMLSQVSAVASAMPGVGNIVGVIQGIAFKMFDVYAGMFLRIAAQQEARIEEVDRRFTVKSIRANHTPVFPVWFPEPEDGGDQNDASDDNAANDNAGKDSNWLDDLVKPVTDTMGDAKKKADEVKQKVTSFFETPSTPAPGDPFLPQVFGTGPLAGPSALGDKPKPAKALGALTVTAFKQALDTSLPGFVEKIIQEVSTINADFIQAIYQKLLSRDGTQPIPPEQLYEAARAQLLQRLVGLLVSQVSFLQTAKDASFNVFGTNISPGGLMDKGQNELNERFGSQLDPVLQIAMGNLAAQLEGARKQAVQQKCHTMEVYLGILPWMHAQVFRDTFFPFWDILVDNTFGRIGGPLGDAVKAAKAAMKDAQKQIDKARDLAEKGSKVKDRLLNEGVQAGLGKENLSGYKKDMDAKASRSEDGDGPPAAGYKYPIEGRLTDATGIEIKLSEYKEVKPNEKWQTGELGGLNSQ